MKKNTKNIQQKYFAKADPAFWAAVKKIEMPPLVLREDHFGSLARSIVGQQLSVKAAASIWQKFLSLYRGKMPKPGAVIKTPDLKLRAVGLSNAKVRYLKNLAQFALENPKFFKKIADKTDDEIIAELTTVKGIGKWTVEMFLIFALGRDDIFSHGDLGLRNAVKKIYKLRKDPDPKKLEKISKAWKPYRSHAARYLWKYLENE